MCSAMTGRLRSHIGSAAEIKQHEIIDSWGKCCIAACIIGACKCLNAQSPGSFNVGTPPGPLARCASPLLHIVQACALFRRRGSVECISASSSTLPPSRPSALRAAASSFSPSVGQLHSHRHGDPRRSQSQHSALSNTRRTFVACLRIESQQP